MMETFGKIGILAAFVGLAISSAGLYAAEKKESNGEKLFRQHCAVCHPNGGNTIKPGVTLQKKDRDAHGVKTAMDIVGKMRNPGPGMSRYDANTIPDKDAKEIAEYILASFK